MKQYVILKNKGKIEILQRSGNYALLLFPSGTKICYNILGYEVISEKNTPTLFDVLE